MFQAHSVAEHMVDKTLIHSRRKVNKISTIFLLVTQDYLIEVQGHSQIEKHKY